MNDRRPWLVITSISAPNAALEAFAAGCAEQGFHFLVVGDSKSPHHFDLPGCEFWSLSRQLESDFQFARLCPTQHYARKNIGYLSAIRNNATFIRDTDDDNLPRPSFWKAPQQRQHVRTAEGTGWLNVYSWFTDATIWPRGLPLEKVRERLPDWNALPEEESDCPIQQGLADENPDVDAIYRLILPLPQSFRADRRVALSRGAWCPFNSQNTTWFPEAYPLLYLPAYCSFRMTDIWRSFIAQRIAWANNWNILFHEPTVWQERNEHNLMRDFADEVPGYINNSRIAAELSALPIKAGASCLGDNLRVCYARLIELDLIGQKEMPLLEAWLDDISGVG